MTCTVLLLARGDVPRARWIAFLLPVLKPHSPMRTTCSGLPTDPPFKAKREASERAALLRGHLSAHSSLVVAGVYRWLGERPGRRFRARGLSAGHRPKFAWHAFESANGGFSGESTKHSSRGRRSTTAATCLGVPWPASSRGSSCEPARSSASRAPSTWKY